LRNILCFNKKAKDAKGKPNTNTATNIEAIEIVPSYALLNEKFLNEIKRDSDMFK
jgi:hypothetical protein